MEVPDYNIARHSKDPLTIKKKRTPFHRRGRRVKTVTLEEALSPPVPEPVKVVKTRRKRPPAYERARPGAGP